MVKIFREGPHQMEAAKVFYAEASLKMCYLRINKKSFCEATQEITTDPFFLQNTLASNSPRPSTRKELARCLQLRRPA